MTIGSIFDTTYKQIPKVPPSVAGCNATAANFVLHQITPRGTDVDASNAIPFNFFNMSYLYYSPFCLLVGTIVAVVISLATGTSEARNPSCS